MTENLHFVIQLHDSCTWLGQHHVHVASVAQASSGQEACSEGHRIDVLANLVSGLDTCHGRVQQPGRKASELPFGTDIRPRSKQHMQAFLLSQPNESCGVVLSIEVEYPRGRLMEIPWNVSLQGNLAEPGCDYLTAVS